MDDEEDDEYDDEGSSDEDYPEDGEIDARVALQQHMQYVGDDDEDDY